MDCSQHIRIINDSTKIIEKSNNLKTVLSRCDVAINSCNALAHYENHGIPTTQTPPSEGVKIFKTVKTDLAIRFVTDELIKARTKSANAATTASSITPYNKVVAMISDLYTQLEDVVELEKLESSVRSEMDQVKLSAQLEKAEKAEFKGQKSKALNAYLEALYIARKDSIDDRLQNKELSKIEEKIRELGGDVPE